MKNPYFILCFVSSMYLASCTFDEEIKYSCDETTNMWVKECGWLFLSECNGRCNGV